MLRWRLLRVPFLNVRRLGEMFELLIHDRTKAVFEYSGLQYDAEPPS